MSFDLINGLFEFIGGILLIRNVKTILKDKEVKGVDPFPLAFFTLWGLYNCIFYPSLGLYYSFIGGLFVVVVNAIWLSLMIHYKK